MFRSGYSPLFFPIEDNAKTKSQSGSSTLCTNLQFVFNIIKTVHRNFCPVTHLQYHFRQNPYFVLKHQHGIYSWLFVGRTNWFLSCTPGIILSLTAGIILSLAPGIILSLMPGIILSLMPGIIMSLTLGIILSLSPRIIMSLTPGIIISLMPGVIMSLMPGVILSLMPGIILSQTPGIIMSLTRACAANQQLEKILESGACLSPCTINNLCGQCTGALHMGSADIESIVL